MKPDTSHILGDVQKNKQLFSITKHLENHKNLHAWNKCSLVFPILEYCCWNSPCRACQSFAIGLNDSYHNLASSANVKQNLCTPTSSEKLCVFIQSCVCRRHSMEQAQWDQQGVALCVCPSLFEH